MLRYVLFRGVVSSISSRACVCDLPSTSKSSNEITTRNASEKQPIASQRRHRRRSIRRSVRNTSMESNATPLTEDEFLSRINFEESQLNGDEDQILERITPPIVDELSVIPPLSPSELELKKKTGQVKFRQIIYSEGELDNSNLEQPPSRSNPHPFVPDETLPPVYSRSIAPYVNHNPLLQTLVQLGVNLFEIETSTQLSRHLLRLDSEKDVKPKVQWLVSLGFEPADLGDYLTRNPFFLIQNLNDMKTRVNYLEMKKFTQDQIVKIVKEFRYWLNVDVKTIDARLGWIQRQFKLTGSEVRQLIIKEPRVVMFGLGPLQRLVTVLNKDLKFTPDEMKKMLLNDPRTYMMDPKFIQNNYFYVSNVMRLPNSVISDHSLLLRCSLASIKSRHEFLRKLGRSRYEGQKPPTTGGSQEKEDQKSSPDDEEGDFVRIEDFLDASDSVFANKAGKTYLVVYNKFLRSH